MDTTYSLHWPPFARSIRGKEGGGVGTQLLKGTPSLRLGRFASDCAGSDSS